MGVLNLDYFITTFRQVSDFTLKNFYATNDQKHVYWAAQIPL